MVSTIKPVMVADVVVGFGERVVKGTVPVTRYWTMYSVIGAPPAAGAVQVKGACEESTLRLVCVTALTWPADVQHEARHAEDERVCVGNEMAQSESEINR